MKQCKAALQFAFRDKQKISQKHHPFPSTRLNDYDLDFPEQPTLSESTAGGLEPGSVTLDVCAIVIDRPVLVSEDAILAAMQKVRALRGWIIEGAAAVAVAAFLKEAQNYGGKKVAVVICGANLSPEVLARL